MHAVKATTAKSERRSGGLAWAGGADGLACAVRRLSRRGGFCLLPCGPGPCASRCSPGAAPASRCRPWRRRASSGRSVNDRRVPARAPTLTPSTTLYCLEAGSQAPATTPSERGCIIWAQEPSPGRDNKRVARETALLGESAECQSDEGHFSTRFSTFYLKFQNGYFDLKIGEVG